jgi:hypothetical protein
MNLRLQSILVLLGMCLTLPRAEGQIFHPQAGSSSLMDAHGGSVGFEGPSYSGSLGLGFVDGRFELGGVIRTTFKGYEVFAGDDALRFSFPTDVFDSSYYFIGRGIGVAKSSTRGSFKTFVGSSSEFVGTNFFQAARNGSPLFATFGEIKIRSNVALTSSVVLGSKQTIINGVAFRPNPKTLFALSGGMGNNSPYFAAATKLERRRFDFKASYIATSLSFRRTNARTSVVSESDRDNEEFTFRLTDRASFTVARQNLLAPISLKELNGARATVHQLTGSYLIEKFQLSGGVFHSRVLNGHNVGESFRAVRPITRKIDLGFDYNRNQFQSLVNSSWSANVRENITQHISLLQYVNRSAGQTSYSFGGELRTKRLTFGVTNDTAYVPFRPQSAGGPFVRTYNMRVSLRPFRTLAIEAYTNVDPGGKLRYTTYAGDYLYRYEGLQDRAVPGNTAVTFAKYLVKGKVVDAEGRPVAGAAIQVDGELVFSNSDGEFLARFQKNKPVKIHVSLRDFISNDFFEVVKQPSEATPAEEDKAIDIVIELRHVDRATGLRLLAEDETHESTTSNTSSDHGSFIPQN